MSVQPVATTNSPWSWRPDVREFMPEDAVPEALLHEITTHVAAIEGDAVAVRVPLIADETADLVREGDEIDESEPELSETSLFTVKVAKLLRITREMLEQERTEETLANVAARSIVTKADQVLLNQAAPVAPETWPPPGILDQGIPAAGAVAGDVDTLIEALATIRANGGTPSHIVLSPTGWSRLQRFKIDATSNLALLGSAQAPPSPTLLGVTVVQNAAVPAGSGLIVDRSDIISASGPVQVAISDQVYFKSDSYAIRVTWRFGSRVVHPNRHARFTVTDPTP